MEQEAWSYVPCPSIIRCASQGCAKSPSCDLRTRVAHLQMDPLRPCTFLLADLSFGFPVEPVSSQVPRCKRVGLDFFVWVVLVFMSVPYFLSSFYLPFVSSFPDLCWYLHLVCLFISLSAWRQALLLARFLEVSMQRVLSAIRTTCRHILGPVQLHPWAVNGKKPHPDWL